MKHWYVIHAKPRQEETAAEHLARQAFEIYLPKIKSPRRCRNRWQHTIEPLFPRYLFIQLDLGRDNIAPIRSTRGVSKLVSFNGLPARVPESLVETLMRAGAPDTGVHDPHKALFETGATVTIVGGPLEGLQAIYQAHDGEARSIILLELLGKTQQVRIEKDHLWPAHLA